MNNPVILVFFFLFVISSCTPFYIASNFDEKTSGHHSIAILPVEMVFMGEIPEEWSEEDVKQIEAAESRAFQISFYNEVLRSTKSGRKPIRVEIQHFNSTLQMLEENQITIKDSWKMKPEKLASLLHVDAVVQARIQKTRFMSDLESYGIDLATSVVHILTNYRLFPWIPVSTISKQIDATYSLCNGKDGSTLWSIQFQEDADWRRPANEIIDELSRKSAKKFPYRVK